MPEQDSTARSEPPTRSGRAHAALRILRTLKRQIRPDWMIRDVGLLMLARIAMSSGRALTSVIVPIYLTVIGISATQIGLLFGITGLVAAAQSVSIGILSDRFGRKPFLIFVPALTALAGIVFALSRVEGLIFAFAALGSFGRGGGATGGTIGPYAPAEQAYIATAIPHRVRNSVFGRLTFCSAVGAVIGNVMAAIPTLTSRLGLHGANSYIPAFLAVACLAFAAAGLAVPISNARPARQPQTSEPEPDREAEPASAPEADAPDREAPPAERPRRRLRFISLSQPAWSVLLRLWAANSMNGFAVGFIGPFLTLFFYDRYHVGPGTIGILYTLINLATMASILSAANVARKVGLVRAIVIGRTFQGLLLIPMALAPTFWLAGLIYLIRVCFQRFALPLRQSFIMGMVPEEERGSVGGMSNLPSQATAFITPTIGGYLFSHIALELPFELGALFQIFNSGLFWVFFHKMVPPEELEAREARVQADAAGQEREHEQLRSKTDNEHAPARTD